MSITCATPLPTTPVEEWLDTLLRPVTKNFIPLSYKEKSNKAALDPGCHAASALKITREGDLYHYQIVGYTKVDDPHLYRARTEYLDFKRKSEKKYTFTGLMDGGSPFKLTIKVDASNGRVAVKWTLNDVVDHLHICSMQIPALLDLSKQE